MRSLPLAVLMALMPAQAISTPPCESARVLKLRTVERAERPVQPLSSPIYYVSLECAGKFYMARIVGNTRDFDPDELAAAESLHVRADDGKIYLRTEHGTEFEVILAPVPTPVDPASY